MSKLSEIEILENKLIATEIELAAADKTLEKLKDRVKELELFVSACRFAGPSGVELLREEATKLYARRK